GAGDMMDEVVQSRRGSLVLPVVCTALAVVVYFWAGTLSDSQAAIVRALSLPTLLGIGVATLPGRTWRAGFPGGEGSKEALEPGRVDFSRVLGFQILQPTHRGGKSGAAGLVLDGVGGRLRIPARLSVPLADVIEYIGSRIGFGGGRAIDARLVDYCRTH